MIWAFVVAIAVSFYVGKQYGARLEEEAVELALYTFHRAKTALVKASQKALTDIKAKEARLMARVEHYL